MNKREVLDKLKVELGSLEYGRNRRSVRMPWESVSFFQDSVTCLNYGLEGRTHPCRNCNRPRAREFNDCGRESAC